jgi:cholest-4-en-3-one 26-monooxygenase
MTVSGLPNFFINGGPRLRLTLKGHTEILRKGIDAFGESRNLDPNETPDMIFMDNPRHRHIRKLTSWAYTQSSMRTINDHFSELAKSFTNDFYKILKQQRCKNVAVILLAALLVNFHSQQLES